MESFTLSLSLACPGCEHPFPINRLREEHACKACGHALKLNARRWVDLFGPELWSEALDLENGQGYALQIWGRYNAKVGYGRRTPRCQDCKHELGVDLVADVDCACGRRIPVRPADELVQAVVPHARFVVGEAHDEVATGEEPVLFGCLACGAGLSVDGSARTVRCAHCERDSYLPDDLWRKFNPVEKVRTFFVLADIGPRERQEMLLDSDDEDARARLARTTDRLDLLGRLAQGDDRDVRRAVAMNRHAPDDLLLQLVEDAAEQLVKRPALSAGLRDALAGSGSWEVRREVARRQDAPLELLERLAQDRDKDVVAAARANPTYAQAHPVVATVEKARDHSGALLAALMLVPLVVVPLLLALIN